MSSIRVVFVRHGESDWNKLNLFCGWNDVNLSSQGFEEALNITAAALKRDNFTFDLAYCSALKRSNQTLNIILKHLDCHDIPIQRSWRLNERHYGALTGFNKRQMAELYGEEQVQIWRRSFNVLPPAITPNNPYYEVIRSNPKFAELDDDEFPDSESLETTMQRVVPYWENEIVPKIKQNLKILIVAHGTSLRGLVKHIEKLSDQDIMKFNIPNSIPFVYDFDRNMKPQGTINFLADSESVRRAMMKVSCIGN